MAKVSFSQLAEYVVDQLEAGVSSTKIAQMLASYLLENRQSRDGSKVMRAVEAELNKRGKTQVEITSAHEVSREVKKQLAGLLGAKDPVFHETIDPSVIGGVKARAGEQQIDLTVKAKLQRFKAEIVRSD